jgi:GT2 family glycosyltransferase
MVYAVTVNWNRPDDTLECLRTLAAQSYPALGLLVVDNGSTDDSVARIQAEFPQADLVASPENLGFAAGANLGLHRALGAGADMVFLINNDTLVDPEAVAVLAAHVRPDVGILAPLIYYAEEPTCIWSAGGMRGHWTLDLHGDDRGVVDTGQWRDPVARDFVTGCGMLLTRELVRRVGYFDERFFMYYEDSDLCLRAQGMGFKVLLVPASKMWHKVARSSGGSDAPEERYWMARSSVQFYRKHAQTTQWLAIVPWRIASALRTTLRLLQHGRPEACTAYWRGLRDGWRRA